MACVDWERPSLHQEQHIFCVLIFSLSILMEGRVEWRSSWEMTKTFYNCSWWAVKFAITVSFVQQAEARNDVDGSRVFSRVLSMRTHCFGRQWIYMLMDFVPEVIQVRRCGIMDKADCRETIHSCFQYWMRRTASQKTILSFRRQPTKCH